MQIREMRSGKKGTRRRPHKLVMLLAVADMFEKGLLKDNRIYFDDQLKEVFSRVFELYKRSDDLNQPSPPFFHLRSAEFWHHKIKDGKETSYSLLTTSGGGERRVREHIEYAYLSNYAYEVFSDPDNRFQLNTFLGTCLATINQDGQDAT